MRLKNQIKNTVPYRHSLFYFGAITVSTIIWKLPYYGAFSLVASILLIADIGFETSFAIVLNFVIQFDRVIPIPREGLVPFPAMERGFREEGIVSCLKSLCELKLFFVGVVDSHSVGWVVSDFTSRNRFLTEGALRLNSMRELVVLG